MRKVINIALTQVLQQLREAGSVITLFVVPLIMMYFIGSFSTGFRPSTQVFDVVRAAESGDLADKYVAMLRADGETQVSGVQRFIVCDLGSGAAPQPEGCKLDQSTDPKQRLEDGTANATITLPDGFSADLRAGKAVRVQVQIKGDVSFVQTVNGYVNAVNTRIGGAVLAARAVTEKAGGDDAFYARALANAQILWDKDPVQVQESYSTVTGTQVGTGFGQSAPGIGAMFVLFNVLTLMQVFITERKNWTLQRLMMMPVQRWQILAGKLLGQYLLGVMTFGVMLVGGTVLGVRWGDPLGVVVTVLAYTLAVTALALALSTIVRTSGQAAGVSLLVGLVLSPLGGAWWPLEITPQFMQTVGRIISPIAWSQEAFSKMVFYGATFTDILPQIGVLLLFTAVFFAFGLARFRFE